MAENSKIEWTDHTFNPWMGCTKVHTGCANCYAETLMDSRWGKVQWGPNGTRVVASDATWRNPVKWNKAAAIDHASRIGETRRPRVFCASLADIFEDWKGDMLNAKGEQLVVCDVCDTMQPDSLRCISCDRETAAHFVVMDEIRSRLFALIDATPYLDWLILTKRPENVRRMWCSHINTDGKSPSQLHRKNVWLLTSVSNQESADHQIPELLKCRDLVPVLGLSIEPLVGEIDLINHIGFLPTNAISKVRGIPVLDWVIIGGESGHHARPFVIEYADSIIRQCKAAGLPVFMKQMGEQPVTTNTNMYDWPDEPRNFEWGTEAASCGFVLRDKKGGDMDEWPEEFCFREYPTPRAS